MWHKQAVGAEEIVNTTIMREVDLGSVRNLSYKLLYVQTANTICNTRLTMTQINLRPYKQWPYIHSCSYSPLVPGRH
jgi:hypothetical protein